MRLTGCQARNCQGPGMCPYRGAKEGQQAPARICLCWKVDLGQVMPSDF